MRQFNHRGHFIALKDFRWAGRDHKMGDLFKHRQLSVDPRKLRTLWEARMIEMVDPFSDEAVLADEAEQLDADEALLDDLADELDLDA